MSGRWCSDPFRVEIENDFVAIRTQGRTLRVQPWAVISNPFGVKAAQVCFRLRCRLLFLLTPLLVAVTGCGQHPKLDVSASVEDEQVAFDVPRTDVNGLLSFRVEDLKGTVLWQVDMSYEQAKRIIYGVLPTGGNITAKQVVPSDGSAPPNIRGREVQVRIEYQYDEFAAASAASFVKLVQIP